MHVLQSTRRRKLSSPSISSQVFVYISHPNLLTVKFVYRKTIVCRQIIDEMLEYHDVSKTYVRLADLQGIN